MSNYKVQISNETQSSKAKKNEEEQNDGTLDKKSPGFFDMISDLFF